VAEGVTIVTQQNNKEFFERALNTPRTLLNDTLAKNPKKVKVETICREEGVLRTARGPWSSTTSIRHRTPTG
jgi:hypothetical protein